MPGSSPAPLSGRPALGRESSRLVETPPPSPFQQYWTLVAAALALATLLAWLYGNTRVTLLVGNLVVLCCVRVPYPRAALVAAALLSALWVAAALVAPGTAYPRLSPPDAALALAVTWVSALFVHRAVLAVRKGSDASFKALADISHALDQSAIVAMTDVHGTIRSVNQKFCDISKYSAAELLGQDHRLVNSGYHSKEFIRGLWRTIAQGRIWRGELRNRAKDGSFYWVDTTIVPFLDPHGKPYQYVAIRYDITERKRSEAQLRQQESLARLGEMAAVVAHEVRNPIAGIKGALQVVGSRLPAGTRDRDVLNEVTLRLDGLNELVQDLLLFARPGLPQKQQISSHAAVQATIDLMRRDPQASGVAVQIVGQDVLLDVDRQQLGTVLLNLLLNAAQAQQGTGRITVETDRLDGMVQLRIRDTGPGIPADIRGHIFEPFFTTKHRGTGLGLATARRLTELNDGSIQVDCPEGGGTVVVLAFPAAPSPPGPVADAGN